MFLREWKIVQKIIDDCRHEQRRVSSILKEWREILEKGATPFAAVRNRRSHPRDQRQAQ